MSREVSVSEFQDVSHEWTQPVKSKVLNCSIAIALLIIAAACLGLSAWGLTETYMYGSYFTITLVSAMGIIFGGGFVVVPLTVACIVGAKILLTQVFKYQEPAIPNLLDQDHDML